MFTRSLVQTLTHSCVKLTGHKKTEKSPLLLNNKITEIKCMLLYTALLVEFALVVSKFSQPPPVFQLFRSCHVNKARSRLFLQ